MRFASRAAVGLAAVTMALADAGAQVTETPAAFDSAGRVRSLTPALVTRLQLTAPEWPVTGTFREARLFAVGDGSHILSVERSTGAVERYPLSDQATRSLREAVDRAMTARGAIVTESQTDLISEPAGGKFVRNQMVLTAILYAPAMAAMTYDDKAAAAVYLLATGSSYFVTSSIANKGTITRAMNDLSTDGAFRGAFFASGLLAAFGPEDTSPQAAAAVTLAGALGGSIAGFKRARGLTDAEAKAAKSMSTYAVLTTTGLIGIAGLNDSSDYRATSLASVGAGIAGYMLGPRYPKRSAYTVTAGDINTLWIGSTLGVMTAFIPFVGANDIDERTGWATFTAGLLGGGLLAERTWVRHYDHSQGDVAQMWLGTIAGGLMGGAIVVLTEPSAQAAWTMVTAGSIFGAIGSQKLTRPAPARSRSALLPAREPRSARATFEFSPAAAALAATHVRGRHGLLTIRF